MTSKVLSAALLWVFSGLMALAQAPEQGIIVTGEGRVMAEPDMATITLGVIKTGETSQEAVREVSAAAAAIQNRLKAMGVAKADRQTAGLNLQPMIVPNLEDRGAPGAITGYRASNQITVRIRDIDQSEELLSDVLLAGANNFNSLTFALEDTSAALAAARRAAVQDATLRAAQLAEAAGLSLGTVLRMTENSGFHSPSPMMMAESRAVSPGAIVSGEVEVTASVTMVFAIAPLGQ